MNYFEAVEKRASYRHEFKDQDIPENDIIKIVDAGLRAPSGYNMQTTSFVIVRDKELRNRIAEVIPTPATKTAPVMIVALSEKKKTQMEGAAPFIFDVEDYAAAVENILLGITALGYAGVWMDGATRRDEKHLAISKIINAPEGRSVRCVIPFGVPVQDVAQKEKAPFEDRVVWEKF